MTVGSFVKDQLQSSKIHRFLRWGSFLGGLITIVVGVWSLLGISFDLKLIVNAFYEIIFGFFLIMAQIRVERILKKIEILRGYRGLGFFNIFIGGLALGGSWFDYALALYLFLFGAIYLYLALCKGVKRSPDIKAPSVGEGSPEQFHDEPENVESTDVKIEMKEKAVNGTAVTSSSTGGNAPYDNDNGAIIEAQVSAAAAVSPKGKMKAVATTSKASNKSKTSSAAGVR